MEQLPFEHKKILLPPIVALSQLKNETETTTTLELGRAGRKNGEEEGKKEEEGGKGQRKR